MEIIQTLWVGNKFSKIEILSLKSFLENGHDVHLYCYEDIKNVPHGVKIMDANEIVHQDEIFRAHSGSLGAFSDLFRHTLLFHKGGCWVDTDVVCLKSFDFEDDNSLCEEALNRLSTAVLKLSKGNIISEKILENFKSPMKFFSADRNDFLEEIKEKHGDGTDFLKEIYQYTEWGELGGPMAVTKIFSELDLDYTVLIPTTFYPVGPTEWWSTFYDPNLSSKINWEDCYGIHLWNNMFSKYSHFDKEVSFSEGTIINTLFKKYKI